MTEQHNNNECLEFLEKAWDSEFRFCHVCNARNLAIGVCCRIEAKDGKLSYPLYPVMCKTCGNTIFINPKVYESKKQEEKEKPFYTKQENVIYLAHKAKVSFQ